MAKRKGPKKQRADVPIKPSSPGLFWTNTDELSEGESLTFMTKGGILQGGDGWTEVRREMPPTTEGLEELAVGDVAAYMRSTGHKVGILPRPDRWPDAEISIDGSRPVGIEVAELIDPRHPRGAPYLADHERMEQLVAEPVHKKIAKHYDRRGYERLWLLLWSSVMYMIDPPNLTAVELMKTAANPFDELWFCYVAGTEDAAIVERWWPAPEGPQHSNVSRRSG